jgi:hypothetical protein
MRVVAGTSAKRMTAKHAATKTREGRNRTALECNVSRGGAAAKFTLIVVIVCSRTKRATYFSATPVTAKKKLLCCKLRIELQEKTKLLFTVTVANMNFMQTFGETEGKGVFLVQ